MKTDERVIETLHLIQEAQNLIDEAASTLSAVPGYAKEWHVVMKLHGQVKQTWHKVNRS